MSDDKTLQLIDRRKRVVARGVGMFTGNVSVASARGATLIDADGREWIDFASGIGVMNAGHCDEAVVRAIADQAAALLHACIHVSTYEPYVALCEKLTSLLPHGSSTKAMLVNSGAEAVENAVKIARQATGRPAILCYEGAFHGRTLLGMTLTSKSAYKKNCGPFAPEVYRLPCPNYFRYGRGRTEDEFVAGEVARIEERFIAGPVPAEHVAAVIIETVQGEGGFVPIPRGYLQALRKICDAHGILLICDEVQTGFCRTGKWAAYEHAGIVPDLSTWAKAMGGGLPIGAVLGRAEVMDRAEPGTIGGTFGGNPVACAAALATIRIMEEMDLNARARAVGARLQTRLDSVSAQCDSAGDVRGLGAMMAIEFCVGRDPRQPATALAQAAAAKCRERGLLVLTAGPYGNIIRCLAPLVIDDSTLERGLDVLESSVLDAAREASS